MLDFSEACSRLAWRHARLSGERNSLGCALAGVNGRAHLAVQLDAPLPSQDLCAQHILFWSKSTCSLTQKRNPALSIRAGSLP